MFINHVPQKCLGAIVISITHRTLTPEVLPCPLGSPVRVTWSPPLPGLGDRGR